MFQEETLEMNNALPILVIDQEPMTHQQIAQTLFANGFLPSLTLDEVRDSEEGISKIADAIKSNKAYGIVLLDISMTSEWDYIDIIKKIWALDPMIQVVICSNYLDSAWDEAQKNLDATTHLLIIKTPVDDITVKQLMDVLIKKWHLMQNEKQDQHTLTFDGVTKNASMQQSMVNGYVPHLLTGLPNREFLMDYLRKLIIAAEKHNHLFAMMLLEINHSFPDENAVSASHFNAEFFQIVIDRLLGMLPGKTVLTGLDGHELVMVNQFDTQKQLITLVNQVMSVFKPVFKCEKGNWLLTAHMGIAIYPDHGEYMDVLLDHADVALKLAKSAGDHAYHIYDSKLTNAPEVFG